jgi:tRNA U34 5-carboxymethylaminomethyl modifying GTPase MnmE/TrmE
VGTIAVIWQSGSDAFTIADALFPNKCTDAKISGEPSHTTLFGNLVDVDDIIEEVLLYVFRSRNPTQVKKCLRFPAMVPLTFRRE